MLLRLPVFLLFLTLTIAACGQPDRSEEALLSVQDALGRTISYQHPPQRIVTTAPNLTEIVFAAGGDDRLVLVSTADDYPPAVDTIARFNAVPIDFESIIRAQPDLVLASNQVNSPRDAEMLQAAGIPVYFFDFDSLTDIVDAIRETGELLGTSEAADAAALRMEQRLRALRTNAGRFPEPPRVLLLISDDVLYTFNRHYAHEMIELAGGWSITSDLKGAAAVLSDEFVLRAQPDVIIGTFGPDYDPDRLLVHHPTWRHLHAIQEKRVFSLSESLVHRPSPRVLDGIEQIARYLEK